MPWRRNAMGNSIGVDNAVRRTVLAKLDADWLFNTIDATVEVVFAPLFYTSQRNLNQITQFDLLFP